MGIKFPTVPQKDFYKFGSMWYPDKKHSCFNRSRIITTGQLFYPVPRPVISKRSNSHKQVSWNIMRRLQKSGAAPKWLNKCHKEQIKWHYEYCELINKSTGIPHEVDHIEPLNSPTSCGLHVPWNLQVTSRYLNRLKRNQLLPL